MSAGNVIAAGALDRHIAILGVTGSGKSKLAKTAAEDLPARGARICVIDPAGTRWGLRLMAGGAAPSGRRIVIFGGRSWTPPPQARVNFQTTFPTMWASSARHS